MSDHQEATIIYGYDLGMHDSLLEEIEEIWTELHDMPDRDLITLGTYGTWTQQEGYVLGIKSTQTETGYCATFTAEVYPGSIDDMIALSKAKETYIKAGFIEADAEPSWLLCAYYG